MISEKRAKSYCRDDISLIENYDKAIADDTQVWDCHHRRETIFSSKDLIEIGEYYNRPACELIFLTKSEHMRLHNIGKKVSAEARKKMSEARKGKPKSAETRKKMSEANKGKPKSAEARKKMSEAKNGENNPMFGKHHSAETHQKMSEAHKGKHHSAETRQKMSESHNSKNYWTKGTHWYNNGVKCIKAKTCPEGFVPGRLK